MNASELVWRVADMFVLRDFGDIPPLGELK
jgi:hypothetical protein